MLCLGSAEFIPRVIQCGERSVLAIDGVAHATVASHVRVVDIERAQLLGSEALVWEKGGEEEAEAGEEDVRIVSACRKAGDVGEEFLSEEAGV